MVLMTLHGAKALAHHAQDMENLSVLLLPHSEYDARVRVIGLFLLALHRASSTLAARGWNPHRIPNLITLPELRMVLTRADMPRTHTSFVARR